ncbi:MAG: Rpn family recombination-promoting nuclease/putative transposase [Kiritimatiellae bacterium]|nr:Rpn family recombination-promoting nuclease/putative transposase [Kiritimatiellia bacterium]
MSTQFKIANLHGHSTILDVRAVDAAGRIYDIEIQRADSGAGARRARYYAALLDASALKASEDYESLPEAYVIFITEEDVFGRDEAVYEFDRIARKCNLELNDGMHVLYVHGAKRTAPTRLGKMLHDFFCSDPDKMKNKEFAQRAKDLKQKTEGRTTMCRILERVRERGRAEGEAKGLVKGRLAALREMARRMLAEGKLSMAKIAEYSGLALREVRKLNAEMKKSVAL